MKNPDDRLVYRIVIVSQRLLNTLRTFPVGVRIAVAVRFVRVTVPEASHSEIGDFQNEPAVHHAVARFETAVRTDVAAVQVTHSLEEKKTKQNCCRLRFRRLS